ncbi:MAG: hypothetical protein JSU58_05130 [Dehalococcoidales bacterium]|nr:MAG: hypothetical protein JSU58_05130 [Dehalococcoidales bacterium]
MKSLPDTPATVIIDENIPGIYAPRYVYRENRLLEVILDERDMAIWKDLVNTGLQNAFRGLSELLHHKISLNTVEIGQIPVNDVLLLSGTGAATRIGICLLIDTYIIAQLMLIYAPNIAYQFIDIMLALTPGSTES